MLKQFVVPLKSTHCFIENVSLKMTISSPFQGPKNIAPSQVFHIFSFSFIIDIYSLGDSKTILQSWKQANCLRLLPALRKWHFIHFYTNVTGSILHNELHRTLHHASRSATQVFLSLGVTNRFRLRTCWTRDFYILRTHNLYFRS